MTKPTPAPTVDIAARTKLTRARIAMIMKQPFFGELAMRLKMVEKRDLKFKTLATNGKTFYYDPDWVNNNDDATVQSGVAHEVGHCIFQHIGRRNGREPQRWNQAGDYVINAVLKDCGFTFPGEWLYSPVYAGMSTDQVYQALPPMPPSGGGGNGHGDAFDEIADYEPGDPAPEAADIEWQVAAVQAAENVKRRGNVPGSLQRFIDEIVVAKPDWRAVMTRFATEVNNEDFSYARVNRRFAALNIFLPGLYSQSMGEMAAVFDTSGSIGPDIMNAFAAHLTEIRDQMKPAMTHLMYCDARVAGVDEFEKYDSLALNPRGGGGTDFRPPFLWFEERGIEPKCFMYLTDGYGPFPAEPPPYPVLWLMTTDVVPPWGEVVRIEV